MFAGGSYSCHDPVFYLQYIFFVKEKWNKNFQVLVGIQKSVKHYIYVFTRKGNAPCIIN
jgi:hypothetical protein